MKRYFKYESESFLGEGTKWIEFEGELATRQVEKYGDRWFSSRRDYHPEIGLGLLDQSFSDLHPPLGLDEEITAAEFEQVWAESGRQESGRQ
jgi:hypothetical protein